MISYRAVSIPCDEQVKLSGDLALPEPCVGLVVFAHGSGSSRLSPRNQLVAAVLQAQGIGTLLFDLLTAEEDRVYANRFDINLLSERLRTAVEWVGRARGVNHLPMGIFGASTGAAAALRVAVQEAERVRAVVSRGGRPDLAGEWLGQVAAPTLLVVGGDDKDVIELNRAALARMRCERELVVVAHAGHLFEEPGKLQEVAESAAAWFLRHFVQTVLRPAAATL